MKVTFPFCLRSRWKKKRGFSHSGSSAGKSTTFTWAVTVITAVSCHNYHTGLELIVIRWYAVIFLTGLFNIKRQAGASSSIYQGHSLPPLPPPWWNTKQHYFKNKDFLSVKHSPLEFLSVVCFEKEQLAWIQRFKSCWNDKKDIFWLKNGNLHIFCSHKNTDKTKR